MNVFKLLVCSCLIVLTSCSEDNDDSSSGAVEKNLSIKLKFDATEIRLGNLGEPVCVEVGTAAQSPNVSKMSANYIEFAPSALTALGTGEIIFEGAETTEGGARAIHCQNAIFAGHNETFLSLPLSQVRAGHYEWVRVSLAYQEGDIQFLHTDGNEYTGTLASFVGYNTYISEFS